MKHIKTYQIFESYFRSTYYKGEVPLVELKDICLSLIDKIGTKDYIVFEGYGNKINIEIFTADDIKYSLIKDDIDFICNYLHENHGYSLNTISIFKPYNRDCEYHYLDEIPFLISSSDYKFMFTK